MMKHMMKINAVGSALALAGVLAFSGQAVADQVRGDYLGYQGGNINTNQGNGGAGRFTFDRDVLRASDTGPEFEGILKTHGGPTNLGGNDDVYYAFCLEPNETVMDPETYDVLALSETPIDGVSGPMGTRAEDMKLLFGNVYPDFSVAIDTQKAIALQIAVWEIANETADQYDVDTGVMQFNNRANERAMAQNWLTAINDGSWTTKAQGLVGLSAITEDRQDFVAQVVPIPAAAWLFGSAIVGAVALGRRKKKAETQA